jgi:hypothetical protein
LKTTNFLDRAMTDVLLRAVGDDIPTWRLALARVRAKLIVWPGCPVCARQLEASRMVWQGKLFPDADPAPGWRFLFACPECLTVARFDWTEGWASHAPAEIEATGPIVARLRERLAHADEAGRLADEVSEIRADADRAWLLAIPELFELARRGLPASVRLVRHLEIRPLDERSVALFPSGLMEATPWTAVDVIDPPIARPRPGGHVLVDGAHVLLAGTVAPLIGLRGAKLLLGRPAVLGAREWRAVDGFLADPAAVMAP